MSANLAVAESAIIVPVEVPVALRRLRDGLDPAASVGVPAHITLLYPFVPPFALNEDIRVDLMRTIASEPVFPFVLGRVERWPDVVYLPPEPGAPFGRLIERLAAAYPDYPPYGGAHALADIVPHLTVAQSERADYLDAAAHALPAMLPVRAVCREAWLIGHAVGQRWETVWKFALGA